MRVGISSDERARIKDLMCEVKELRKANEILELASAFFPKWSSTADSSPERSLLIKVTRPMGSSRFGKYCKLSRLTRGSMLPVNASPNCFALGPNVMKP